jgi:hypothetical protein
MTGTSLVVATASLALVATVLGTATPAAGADFPEPAKLPSQTDLPDPLRTFGGDRVTTPEQWVQKRRPELKALFQHYEYGNMPAPPEKLKYTVEREDNRYFGGKATKKEITISLGPPEAPAIHLLLVVPNARKKPAPVFLGPNFAGNHTAVKDPSVALPTGWVPNGFAGVKDNRATEAGRGTQIDVWAIEGAIDRGYAVATFYCGDVEPDRPEAPDGIRKYFRDKGLTKAGPQEWGAIAAWAWGIHRAVDYLVTDKDIDKARIAVVGHSRLGKTALLAGAFDERIALVIPHQAGCGGTAPSRGKVGESVKQINDRFPHWFCPTFKEFNGQPDRLPFDQHCLVALVAPRPVLLSNAVEDTWANPEGQFEVLRAAEPVYRLLKAGGLETEKMPAVGKLSDGKIGYFIRPGKHSMGKEDWKVFLDFADKHLKEKDGPRPGQLNP